MFKVVLFVGAVLALIAAQPAAAQNGLPAACASFSATPAIPDGATASNAAMTQARDALQAWRGERASQIAACKAVLDHTLAQLNAIEAAHNRAVTETDAAIARFTLENAEYTERARGGRRQASNRRN